MHPEARTPDKDYQGLCHTGPTDNLAGRHRLPLPKAHFCHFRPVTVLYPTRKQGLKHRKPAHWHILCFRQARKGKTA